MKCFQWKLASGAALCVGVALAGLLIISACSSGVQEPGIPTGAGFSTWFQNGAQGRYVVPVVEGTLPAGVRHGMWGRVLTDSNCAPDAIGLNHCHNIIELNDGSRVAVVNNHQMIRHRCLKPGERVWVSLLKGRWITVLTQA